MSHNVFKLATRAARRRWAQRRYFAGLRDWFITLYDSQVRYAKKLPLPGRKRSMAVQLHGDSEPIFLRLGRSDGAVMEEIFITDVYAPVTRAAMGKVEQIVDLGANVGLSVRLWQRRFPEARIIAVEPDPNNFAAARKNLAADPQHRVQLFRVLIGAAPGLAYLDRSADECAFMMTATPTGDPIEVTPLVDLLKTANFEGAIDLLKVDIEGAEQQLFAECAPWIHRVRFIMIELHPNYSQDSLFSDLRRAGVDFQILWRNQTGANPLFFMARNPAPSAG